MKQLHGKLVELCSHRHGESGGLFRVIEVHPAIGFVKIAPERSGEARGFWVESDAVRESERRPS